MTRYRGNRKHGWLPCVISAEITDETTDEELEAICKATYWSDLITASEWPALLGREGASRSARSRLKKKAVGWWMAMGRIAALDPKFYNEIVAQAQALYAEQIRQPHPCFDHSETDEDEEAV